MSSPRVGHAGSVTDELIRRLRERGADVAHLPPDRATVAPDDPRLRAWDGWYNGGCEAAVAQADTFVAVVDDAYTCSTWMGIEFDPVSRRRGERRPGQVYWYESTEVGGARHLPTWWADGLGERLPDDLTAAVGVILTAANSPRDPDAAT